MAREMTVAPQSALAVRPDQQEWTPEQKAALVQIGIDEATPGDAAVFLNYAQRTGLDPFARQIYMIGRYDRMSGQKKWTIQASIDGLRIVAQRSGEYAGQVGPEWCGKDGQWRDVWLEQAPPVAARVGVMRRGFAQPLYAVALVSEYMPTSKDGKPSGLWRSMPAVMIAKCAEALALRKAFPMDLSGIYTAEEMAQADHAPAVVQDAPDPWATPAPSVAPVRDFQAEADALTDVEALRALYVEAQQVLGKDVAQPVLAGIAARAAQVAQAPREDVVDAEVVEEDPAVAESVRQARESWGDVA